MIDDPRHRLDRRRIDLIELLDPVENAGKLLLETLGLLVAHLDTGEARDTANGRFIDLHEKSLQEIGGLRRSHNRANATNATSGGIPQGVQVTETDRESRIRPVGDANLSPDLLERCVMTLCSRN
ncbi:protein of unknown function [Hyphomicrobium sp. MC1]|nr:protein of unknown function [Hyphomicrobium sp. MC1]